MEIESNLMFHKDRLAENIAYLDDFFQKREMTWTLVIKLFNSYDSEIIDYIQDLEITSIASDNLIHLQNFKRNNNKIETWFLNYDGVDINDGFIDVDLTHTMNNTVAQKCFMLEMDPDRFGIKMEDIQSNEFYNKITRVGAYLDCENLPNKSFIKKWKSFSFSNKILQSLGTSVSMSEVDFYRAAGINHFRIGEVAFFGKNLLENKTIKGLRSDIFEPVSSNTYHFISTNK